MAITAGQVVVGAAAVALNATESGVSGTKLIVKNSHATDAVVLGDSTVTSSTGFSLAAGATATVELAHGEILYGIRGAAADVTVHVLRTGA